MIPNWPGRKAPVFDLRKHYYTQICSHGHPAGRPYDDALTDLRGDPGEHFDLRSGLPLDFMIGEHVEHNCI